MPVATDPVLIGALAAIVLARCRSIREGALLAATLYLVCSTRQACPTCVFVGRERTVEMGCDSPAGAGGGNPDRPVFE